VQNYLEGTLIISNLKMINKMSTSSPLEKFLRTPMHDCAFSLSFFRYFRAFTHYKLFVSFCSLNFGCKINRINPLLVLISSKLPAITNVIHKVLWVLQTIPNDNWNYKVPHLKSTDLSRIQVTIRSLAATYKSNSATALCWLLPPVIMM